MDDPLIGTVLGPCLLRRLIGEGGMGRVYHAWHRSLKKDVAVKVLPDDDPESIARFRREATSAARLEHSNIVQVYDVGFEGGRHYIVEQYVPGKSLQTLLDERPGPLPLQDAAPIAMEITKGLRAAHARGIVHRDVKPANVLISDQGEIKIADFGLAAPLAGPRLTLPGTAVGTPHYLAPEQAEGRPPDPRSDLYSLGVVLYRMVSGRLPFEAADPWTVVEMHLKKPPPPLSELPRAWGSLVQRLLEKDPNARFGSADELLQALICATRGPVPTARREAKRPRSSRRPWGWVVGSVVACGLLMAVILQTEKSKPSPRPVSPTFSPPEEERDWEVARARGTAGAYREYLHRHPNGRHRADAEAAIQEGPSEVGFQPIRDYSAEFRPCAHLSVAREGVPLHAVLDSSAGDSIHVLSWRGDDTTDFTLRGEILAPRSGIRALGRWASPSLYEPARRGWVSVDVPPVETWTPFEWTVRDERCELRLNGRTIRSEALRPDTSPFGAFGFSLDAGSEVRLRSLRLRRSYLVLERKSAPDLGLQVETARGSVLVISPGSGLQNGDYILAIDGAPVRDRIEFTQALRSVASGTRIRVRVRRGAAELDVIARVP